MQAASAPSISPPSDGTESGERSDNRAQERAVGVGELPAALLRLRSICEAQDLGELGERLDGLSALVGGDLLATEAELLAIERSRGPVMNAGRQLLDGGGKRLRPLCLALAARMGPSQPRAVRDLAVAVELVHSATLLHDDVVDLGTQRRGRPTSRLIYGNAASIFAGDWFLIEAIRRLLDADAQELLPSLLEVIDGMIGAESIQLESRDLARADLLSYEAVVLGKTAALFRWALAAGGWAGGLDAGACRSLAGFGEELGYTFQLVDDLLDFTGEAKQTGKALFADLREGKATHPLLVALERHPPLRQRVQALLVLPPEDPLPDGEVASVLSIMGAAGSFEATRQAAEEHAAAASDALTALPDSPAKTALSGLAALLVHRIR